MGKSSKRKPAHHNGSKQKVPNAPLRGDGLDPMDVLVGRVEANAKTYFEYLERAEGDPVRLVEMADGDFQRALDEANELMTPWNPLDILAWVKMSITPRAENYRESTHEGIPAVLELAALLLLAREDASSTESIEGSWTAQDTTGPLPFVDVCRELMKVLNRAVLMSSISNMAVVGFDGQAGYVRWRIRQREVMMRNPGYAHLEDALLKEHLGDDEIRGWMVELLGFDVFQALSVAEALGHCLEDALSEGAARGRAGIEEFDGFSNSRRIHGGKSQDTQENRVRRLFVAAVASDRLGQRTAISPRELAVATGLDEEVVRSVLDAFSQPFRGSLMDWRVAASEYVQGKNLWRLRPILDAGDDRFFAIDIGLMISSMREVVAKSLPEQLLSKYAKRTADWMEDRAIKALTSVLKPIETHRNLLYIHEDGKTYELDALLICDRVAIPVEVKGVSITQRARAGDERPLKTYLEKLVTETMDQAHRVRETIFKDGGLRIRDKRSSKIRFPQVTRIFPIAVTLDDVSTIGGTIVDLIDAGAIDFRTTPPWVVSLHDLIVICEIVEGPGQLLAYLDQHELATTFGVLAVSEELDLFMMFLRDGLWMTDLLDSEGHPSSRLFVPSQTDDLDAYFLFQTGLRKQPAPKPTQRWSPMGFKSLIRMLESGELEGWTTAVINLYQTGRDARKDFGSFPRRLARKSRQDHQVHDATYCFTDPRSPSFGVSWISAAPNWDEAELLERTTLLALVRKHLQRASSWTAIGVLPNRPNQISTLVQLDEPWQENEEMDEIARQLGLKRAEELPPISPGRARMC